MSSNLSPEDAALLDTITEFLREKAQFVQHLEPDDLEGINRIRSLGRRAARNLGWRVRTFASDPARRDDGKVVVIVAVTESSPLHQQLMGIRSDKAIRRMFDSWDTGSSQDG